MTTKKITKQWTEALLAAVKERGPHIDWSTITAGGAAIIGAVCAENSIRLDVRQGLGNPAT
jgi:hypothetical protein